MFYGAIKDALMIRYEYSAEWQLISRRRALSAASSAANLAHMTGSSHHSQAIFTRCPWKMIFFLSSLIGSKYQCVIKLCCHGFFLFVCLFCQTAGLRPPQLLVSLVVSGWHHTWEGDLRAFTAYARIMLNGLITKPKLGIHYTAHHREQTSQSRGGRKLNPIGVQFN